jgi:hypothetical protein
MKKTKLTNKPEIKMPAELLEKYPVFPNVSFHELVKRIIRVKPEEIKRPKR